MDVPQEMLLPDHGVPGSEGQSDTNMTDNNDQEISDSTSESEESLGSDSESVSSSDSGADAGLTSEEAADHQAPEVILTTPIDEMYENLINEIESDVKTLTKLPERPRHFLRSPTLSTPTSGNAKLKTPGPLKAKGFRVEKVLSKKKGKKSERVLRAIQAKAEALHTDPNSDTDETQSPALECQDEWAVVQRASRLMNPESIQKRPRLVFWTDGSCESRPYYKPVFASSVTSNGFLEATSQTQLYVHVPVSDASGPYLQSPDASGGEEVLPSVYILTDWAEGLTWIKRHIDDNLGALGVLVRLCWVPGHVGLEGNACADELAKAAKRCLAIDLPRPRNLNEPFEAFLISPGKNIIVVGGCSPDGSYDSSDWEDFDRLFNPTPNEEASVPGDESFDFGGWARIDKILDEVAPPRTSSELKSLTIEGSDEMCE
ncbi:hypothetical protein PG994_014854 [Apiospora phragmitis]|uniref:RNase H type-1 domain-containing protein n=1 Tax=Apiospora phragmitis TaxID=2905665 RepID=A0ABR1SUT1_9PEZI